MVDGHVFWLIGHTAAIFLLLLPPHGWSHDVEGFFTPGCERSAGDFLIVRFHHRQQWKGLGDGLIRGWLGGLYLFSFNLLAGTQWGSRCSPATVSERCGKHAIMTYLLNCNTLTFESLSRLPHAELTTVRLHPVWQLCLEGEICLLSSDISICRQEVKITVPY